MADDFEPLTIPGVLTRDVVRVTADGRPTAHLLNWESSLQAWMQKNTTDLRTKITTVRDENQQGLAEVNERVVAVVDDQGALASQITDLTAEFNGFSANGQIVFKAMAGPAGAIAAYGIFLTAGDVYTGMQLVAYSGGLSAVVFDANYFQLNTSGTGQNVFTFDGSVFTFNVPIRLGNGELFDGAVSRAWAEGGATSASVDVDYRGSGFLEIYAQFIGDASAYSAIDQFVIRVKEDGVTIGDTPINQAQNGTGTGAASRYGSTNIVYIRAPSAGAHTYSVEIVKTIAATGLSISGVLITAKEFSK